MFKKHLIFAGWLLFLSLLMLLCFVFGELVFWKTENILLLWFGMVITGVAVVLVTNALLRSFKLGKKASLFGKHFSRTEFVMKERWNTGAKNIKRRSTRPWYIMLDESGCISRWLRQNVEPGGVPMDLRDRLPGMLRWYTDKKIAFLQLSSRFFDDMSTYNSAWLRLVTWIQRLPAPAGVVMTLTARELLSNDGKTLAVRLHKLHTRLLPLSRKSGGPLALYTVITECENIPAFSLWTSQLSATQLLQPLGSKWSKSEFSGGHAVERLMAQIKQTMDYARLSMPIIQLTADEQSELLVFPETFSQLRAPLIRYFEPLYTASTIPTGLWFTGRTASDNSLNELSDRFLTTLFTDRFPNFHQTIGGAQRNSVFRRLCVGILAIICCVYIFYCGEQSIALMVQSPSSLPIPDLVHQLVINEKRNVSSWRYFPFLPLLAQQHRTLEQLLVNKASLRSTDLPRLVIEYRGLFQQAKLTARRDMILSLAETILALQDIRDSTMLNALVQKPLASEALPLFDRTKNETQLVHLVLLRYAMQHPMGEKWLVALRGLLSSLVNSDPELKWLTAPAPAIPDLQAANFWSALPHTIRLRGIWTRQGQHQLVSWIALLNQANDAELSDSSNAFRLLEQFKSQLTELRQIAWLKMLTQAAPLLSDLPAQQQSPEQVLSLSSGNSPAIKFAQMIVDDLDDIPPDKAQDWLNKLRRLQALHHHASTSPLGQHVQSAHNTVRNYLNEKLQIHGSAVAHYVAPEELTAWKAWRESMESVALLATSPSSDYIAQVRAFLSPVSDTPNDNLLSLMLTHYSRLHSLLAPETNFPGNEAVWLLYRSDADTLFTHALNATACWLNEQWYQSVVWPIRNTENSQKQAVAWQGITAFIRGPGRGLLHAGIYNRQPNIYNGRPLPLEPSFLALMSKVYMSEELRSGSAEPNAGEQDKLTSLTQNIAQLKQQQEQEKVRLSVDVLSEPVTVPGGARVVPTGMTLTLKCYDGDQTLDSQNLAISKQFYWQPGQCRSVILSIHFPRFSVRLAAEGPDAWPDFLARFTNGSALFNASEFAGDAEALHQNNIRNILVQLQLSGQQILLQTWANWQETDNNISRLTNEQQKLMQEIASRQPGDILKENLGLIPDKVAQCQ